MGKAAVATPLYISFAWTLMVSYQFFTQTAVTTVIAFVGELWPLGGAWLISRIEMIIFIYAFSWVFLLSSAIPSVILGKEKGVLVQFFVCLTLTFAAFVIQDILATYVSGPIKQLFSLAVLFQNPVLAVGYLSIPYVLMLIFDVHSRRKRRKEEKEKEETLELETIDHLHEEEGVRPHAQTAPRDKVAEKSMSPDEDRKGS
ncbi:MAG: hypothetical protein JSV57_03275 [Candidatus Bathyarchaeota archaeon]|nr:MAG: hypothetical protein JSV57_03275 [Candidatus Bathyarchaeota archaeon]